MDDHSATQPAQDSLPAIASEKPSAPESVPAPQPTGGTSLAELEQIAREQHPKVLAAQEAIRAAEGRAWQAGRPPNPQIAASSPQLAGSQSQYNAFISQDILTGGKLRLDSAAAGIEAEQTRLAQVRVTFEVLTAVRRQFYATLALQQRVTTLQELQRITAKSAQLGEDLLKAGEGARPDVLILLVEADKAEVALQNAETNLAAARRQLATAAGLPELEVGTLAGQLNVGFPRFDWLSLQTSVTETSAELARADAEVRRSRLLLDRAIVEPRPKFNVMGGYQRQVDPAQDQGLFQVMMSVPLWDRNTGGIEAARANHFKAHAEYQQTRLTLSEQATDALKRYRLASQQVEKFQNEILPRSKESLELTQQLYEKGQADFLDLLAIQRTLQEVNLNHIDAQEARISAAADIANLLQLEQFP